MESQACPIGIFSTCFTNSAAQEQQQAEEEEEWSVRV